MRRGTRTTALVAAALAGTVALTGCGSDRERPSFIGEGIPTDGGEQDEEGTGGDGAEDKPAAGGNGVTDLPPREMVSRAMDAVTGADSLRLSGTIEESPGQLMEIDMLMDVRGDCAGTVAVAGEGSFELLKRGNELWYQPDTEFWQAVTGSDMTELSGMYLYGTTDNPDAGAMAEMCDLEGFLGNFGDVSGMTSDEVSVGEESTHLNVPVIALHEVPKPGSSRESTLLIATEGEPYLMHMEQTERGTTNAISMSDFDVPVDFDEPAAHLVLDLEELANGGAPGGF
ncbi:hypothetical protein [Streptomyces sp. G-5]|uniref:hypothetical protein n=1 Tax=Streptomyces TaxID=1883 RepID=UPI0021CF3F05|nr:hypothetical protein [Streptomyces sp. G-5]MCU4747305.1 hypothetical protein [Streptomyces sp. G-5]